jgi:dGTP triphosphohydrolase
MTAVEWLFNKIYQDPYHDMSDKEWFGLLEQAKEMEKVQRIKDYNAGYDDAQLNHINDAANYVYESEYLNSK